MCPDLTNGKGRGKSPALGINREGSFVWHAHFLEYPCPSAEVKSLVKKKKKKERKKEHAYEKRLGSQMGLNPGCPE